MEEKWYKFWCENENIDFKWFFSFDEIFEGVLRIEKYLEWFLEKMEFVFAEWEEN